jgi:hypothetical protein
MDRDLRVDVIQCMLRRQPIQGSLQVAFPLYLHTAVDLALLRVMHPESGVAPVHMDHEWEGRQLSIRALLTAGADLGRVDDEGNTPLAPALARSGL